MRRRESVKRELGQLPPEFALGRCIEVWGSGPPKHADPDSPWAKSITTFTRFSGASHAYLESVGLSWGTTEHRRAIPGSSPWSIAHMIANGHADQVESRLQKAGVTMSDIPRLQKAAQRWVQIREAGHDRRP